MHRPATSGHPGSPCSLPDSRGHELRKLQIRLFLFFVPRVKSQDAVVHGRGTYGGPQSKRYMHSARGSII